MRMAKVHHPSERIVVRPEEEIRPQDVWKDGPYPQATEKNSSSVALYRSLVSVKVLIQYQIAPNYF